MDARSYQCFSELIKAIRRRHRISQRALAKQLKVSPGYIGQWELRLSQPSAEVAVKLCRTFDIEDVEYVQRLAYAQRAPEWLRESIINYREQEQPSSGLTMREQRVIQAIRSLSDEQAQRLTERIEGWVEALQAEREDEPA